VSRGFIVDRAATVLCAHGGQAQPLSPNARVLVSGQSLTTVAVEYVVAGCPLPASAGGPCVSGRWLFGGKRVLAAGVAVVIEGSPSICTPTGTALNLVHTQGRVAAS
jgi:hypothetical protein